MIDRLAKYNRFKAQMKSGDCLLWQSRSIIGWLIRKFTSAKVNHAGLVIRPPEYGHFKDRRFTVEALEQGIQLRLLSERLREFKGRVWWYPLRDEYEECRDKIAEWALEQEGTPYDYHSLFANIAGRVSADTKRFFCSEFCFMGWKEAGIPVFRCIKQAPRPGDIPKFRIFKTPILIF
ncbi:MAG TPA: YiiX/YebB-like N1pC/P60 family cysteine hydrolase [Desulfatiglandales bacterium]|nr:YiiX/YebB-like N1pC/P60 family cysteine hydrolase [Desulfatiglandales bacterium]